MVSVQEIGSGEETVSFAPWTTQERVEPGLAVSRLTVCSEWCKMLHRGDLWRADTR